MIKLFVFKIFLYISCLSFLFFFIPPTICNAESLVWERSSESDLAGYKVYYGTSPGNYTSVVDVGNVTEYELCGVPAGNTYYLAVTVYDIANNESDFSEEVSIDTYDEICKCKGDLDFDQDVDGSDAELFREHYGRSLFNNPCTDEPQCVGDFDCDQDVDGRDALLFKSDFGRNQYNDPCPACEVGDWCLYP